MTLADRLRTARTAAGLSCRALDGLAGLTLGHANAIERLTMNPGVGTVERLARALGTTVGWLAAGEGEPPTDLEIASAVEAARARNAPTDPDHPVPGAA